MFAIESANPLVELAAAFALPAVAVCDSRTTSCTSAGMSNSTVPLAAVKPAAFADANTLRTLRFRDTRDEARINEGVITDTRDADRSDDRCGERVGLCRHCRGALTAPAAELSEVASSVVASSTPTAPSAPVSPDAEATARAVSAFDSLFAHAKSAMMLASASEEIGEVYRFAD